MEEHSLTLPRHLVCCQGLLPRRNVVGGDGQSESKVLVLATLWFKNFVFVLSLLRSCPLVIETSYRGVFLVTDR